MPPTPVRFASGGLILEGLLHHPATGQATTMVVICHPHPQRGGDMHNSVVAIVTDAVNEAGMSALAFNFRGVGASQGSYDNGEGEQDDSRAALAFARGLDGVTTVALAGYSFGAGVAARVINDTIPSLALVAAPTRMLDAPSLAVYRGPILLATGSLDDISSLEAVRAKAMQLGDRVTVAGIDGADHFWWGKQQELAAEIREFFAPLA